MKATSLAVLFLLLASPQAGAEARKFGVVLGNNLGHDPSRTLRFAEQDARKFHQVLLELGGFDRADLKLLLGATSDEAWQAIKEIERRISQSSGDRLFLLFYSGHADGDELELGRTSLLFNELSDFLKTSQADVRLAFVDSCQSGKLVASKGGYRGPAFTIRVTEEIKSRGYAIITSSADNELSQESREIRGSFFTHYLVSALRGAGGGNQDGQVTLQEAYNYAYSRTVARTSKTFTGSQHPMYDFQLSGKGEIVLTRTGRASSVLSVSGPRASRLLVLDEAESSVVAECEIPGSNSALLALSPGVYQVFMFAGDRAMKTRVLLEPGRQHQIAAADFADHQLERSMSKGGLFKAAWRKLVLGKMMLRRVPFGDLDLSMGAAVSYRMETPSGFSTLARVAWTMAPDSQATGGFFDLGAYLGAGYLLPLGFLRGRLEFLVGYEHLFQNEIEGVTNRDSSGAGYLAVIGVEAPYSNLVFGVDLGIGGRIFKLNSGDLAHRLDVQLLVGMGWKWGD